MCVYIYVCIGAREWITMVPLRNTLSQIDKRSMTTGTNNSTYIMVIVLIGDVLPVLIARWLRVQEHAFPQGRVALEVPRYAREGIVRPHAHIVVLMVPHGLNAQVRTIRDGLVHLPRGGLDEQRCRHPSLTSTDQHPGMDPLAIIVLLVIRLSYIWMIGCDVMCHVCVRTLASLLSCSTSESENHSCWRLRSSSSRLLEAKSSNVLTMTPR